MRWGERDNDYDGGGGMSEVNAKVIKADSSVYFRPNQPS